MTRGLGSYSATLFHLATMRRLVVLALAFIPASLAQSSELIIPTFSPVGGWDGIDLGVMVSQGSSNDYYGQFSCDSRTWSRLMMSVAVRAKEHNTNGEATLVEDGRPVLTFGWEQGGVAYEIPTGAGHIYNYTIKAKSGSPDSLIFVYDIFAFNDGTEAGPTPDITLHETSSSSTQSSVSTTTVISSAASPTSSTDSNIPTTLDATISTEPPSPPAYTNPSASISDTSLVTSGSNSSGPSRSTIIGAVFGAVMGLILCIFAAVLYRLRRVRSHIAPSTAFMSYRSTTAHPPAYPFTRTSFFRRSKAGLASFGGLEDYKAPSPHDAPPRTSGRGLLTLDDAERRDSSISSPIIALEHEEPQRFIVPYPDPRGMGISGGDKPPGVAGTGPSGPVGSPGFRIHRIPRKLVPPLSDTFDGIASTQSLRDQKPYDGLATPETAVNSPVNPFRTPPAEDYILVGRGTWHPA